MSFNIDEVDIEQIFERVVMTTSPTPNNFPLQFDGINITEKFEFLLEFITKLCKHFFGGPTGQVNLAEMTPTDFNIVNNYMMSIGYTCTFETQNANYQNLSRIQEERYDRIPITINTKLSDLKFGLKCNNTLYIISFNSLHEANQNKRLNTKTISDDSSDDDYDDTYNKKTKI